MDINIFTQIGLVVLVGLASKNAILIVEFAKVIRRTGQPIREATLEACRLRLRPIIMTSMAFILGVVPLLFAHGAGAEMRRSLGMAVFSGMLGVTFFGIMLTPVFFYLIDSVSESHLFASPAGAAHRRDRAGDPHPQLPVASIAIGRTGSRQRGLRCRSGPIQSGTLAGADRGIDRRVP